MTFSDQQVSLPRVLAGLAIDYLRWTQLVPMITAWAFLAVMVGAMLLVNFQQQSFSLIEWGAASYDRVFGPVEQPQASQPAPALETLPDAAAARGGTDAGGIRFSGDDFMPWVLKGWGVLALAGWLFGMLFRLLFGPREPMRLKTKLAWAAVPAAACTALFLFAYFFGSADFEDNIVGWILLFAGFPFGVWIVSVYSLSVAHGLDVLGKHIARQG